MRKVSNPPNRFDTLCLEWDVEPPPARLEILSDETKSILSKNDSPDLGFRWSVNPYRGCSHACSYCYARPSHEYLGFGAGTDFETRILVKEKAPELLRKALAKPSWQGELIAFSGDTDCYQPLEGHFKLTRRCLEICLAAGNPLNITTKGFLITRDLDLLARLAAERLASVCLSIPFADDETARLLEPGAPRPSKRFEAMRRLADAGVPVELLVAPIIPGVNDEQIPALLEEARRSGAHGAGRELLRLPGAVAEVFFERLREALPLRASRVEALLRAMRDGELTDSRFHHRMVGKGPYWDAVDANFCLHRKRQGLAGDGPPRTRQRAAPRGQLSLFGDDCA